MQDRTALLVVLVLVILLALEAFQFLRRAPASTSGASSPHCAPAGALQTRLAQEPLALHTASVREATACCATVAPVANTLLAAHPREGTRDPRVATALMQDACLQAVRESARLRRTLTGAPPTPSAAATTTPAP